MGNTALLIVDVQNDFCPGGALAVPHGDQIIDPLNIMLKRAFANKWLVVASKDWHPVKTNHFSEFGGQWPAHCVAGTNGAEFHPGLKIFDVPHHVVYKGTLVDEDAYSAFQGHGLCFKKDARSAEVSLEEMLKLHDVDTLHIGGLATDYCVKATVLDACHLGFKAKVLLNACRGVEINEDDSRQAVMDMMRAGAEILFELNDSMIMRIPRTQRRKGR